MCGGSGNRNLPTVRRSGHPRRSFVCERAFVDSEVRVPSHAFSRSVPSLVLVMSFRFVRLVSRLPACCLSLVSPIGGPFPGCTVPGPSRLALSATAFRGVPHLPSRFLQLPHGSCPDLPPRFLQLPPGSCLTCLRAPCGLFSVRTIRVIPKLPCLPGRALLASGLPVASSRFGPSGLSPNCLPGCALTCLPAFCSSPRFGLFTLPSGCTFSCPPGYFSGSSSLR